MDTPIGIKYINIEKMSSSSASAAAINNQMILNRREYLYGASKKREQDGIKALLREDHIFLKGEYSGDQPDILWTSETANAYFKVSHYFSAHNIYHRPLIHNIVSPILIVPVFSAQLIYLYLRFH